MTKEQFTAIMDKLGNIEVAVNNHEQRLAKVEGCLNELGSRSPEADKAVAPKSTGKGKGKGKQAKSDDAWFDEKKYRDLAAKYNFLNKNGKTVNSAARPIIYAVMGKPGLEKISEAEGKKRCDELHKVLGY